MNEFLTLTAFASSSVILTVAGIALFRHGARALAYWLFGWSVLLQAGFVTLLVPQFPEIYPLSPIFSSFVAPFMLLGALAHSERPEPMWLIQVGFLLGVVRVASELVGASDFSISIAIATEPTIAIAAAWFVLHPRPDSGKKVLTTDRLVALGFVLYAGVEFFDATSHARGTFGRENWIAWVAVGVPLATTQILLHLERIGRRARLQEDHALANAMRLDVLSRSPRDFLSEVDEHGILTWISPGAAISTGRPIEDLVGRNVVDFLDPGADSIIRDALTKRGRIATADFDAASGTSHPALLPDGSRRWFEVLGTSYRTLAGHLRFVTWARDVTARVEHQQALQRSEERLRRAEQIAGVGSWEVTEDGREFFLSDEMYRIHGIERRPGPMLLAAVLETFHPDDLGRAHQTLHNVRELGATDEQTLRIIRPSDGAARTLRVRTEADLDAEGRILRLVGATIDITEQVALTDRLREGQQRFQSLIDSSMVCVYLADRDGAITEANEAFLSLLGYAKDDLPLDWRVLTAPEDRHADAERARMFDSLSLPQPFEKEFLSRDGRRIPMLMSFTLVSPDKAILIGVDLRERKQAEIVRARYQRELEETVADRTRELVESRSRLIEHERLVAVGTLAAGVAHQINNPIGAILNCAEYALLCRDDDEVLEIYERALRDNLAEARRCAQIVRSMLQFARDQPTVKWVEDLNRVTRRAQRAVNAYAEDRGATVTFTTTDDPLLVRMSPIEIEQAIVNVVRNAIESRDAGARVSILLEGRDKTATIEVTDDGRGIAPDQLDHLYEPFFSTRAREGGTGLGLSVTHGVLNDHGGRIRVESVPGTGTRVVMTLPLAEWAEDGGEAPIRGDRAVD
jgi:PAS domain S-box-containing protein